jgi:phosphoglycolate phosphatase
MNQRPALLFDVDGTLLDVREKYWAAHCFLAQELREEAGNRAFFWAMKRRRSPLFQLLSGWRRSSISAYGKRWPATVEMPQFTALDSPFPGTKEVLSALRRDSSLIAISMRRNARPLQDSLSSHGIGRLFDGVLIRGLNGPSSGLDKAGLLQSSACASLPFRWVIGDSDDDVQLARGIGCKSLAVLSGLRDLPYLMLLEPDGVIEELRELPRFLAGRELESSFSLARGSTPPLPSLPGL